MKVLHAIIAMVFIVIGLSIYTDSKKQTPALIALLIGNVSLAAISIETAFDRSPVELPPKDPGRP